MGLRVPISWLNDYVTTSNTEALAERLTLAGLEIESIEQVGQHWQEEQMLVAEILNVAAHPNADRLSVVTVDYGQAAPLEVICGAPNIRLYQNQPLPQALKVPLALPGAVLVDARGEASPLKVKASKIRGILSSGVLCSQKELGISEDHEGVMVLPKQAKNGSSLKALLGDTILYFDIKGGFSHLLAIFGIAREVAALTEQPLNRDILKGHNYPPEKITEHPPFVKLNIEAPRYCFRYSALLIEGVTLAPSPFWMQQRLLRAGMRPINNIVDITNYVMLEMGQPLHAFDHDTLKARAGGKQPTITVRCANPQETITTLDGGERLLDEQMLLITDTNSSIAIAGVMGGANTEISEHTQNILLESANFEFLNNRRTSQILKLRTEASERYGKRLDCELTLVAGLRAAQLMVEHAGGTLHEIVGDLYPNQQNALSMELDLNYVHRLLGISLSQKEVVHTLEKLEFEVNVGEPLHVTVPHHRMDITVAADLVEEVARVYGYNRMKGTLMEDEIPPFQPNPQLVGTEKIRDLLVRIGLDEIITYSIIDLKEEAALSENETLDASQYLGLKNPLTAERTHLRRSLLPGILNTAHKNLRLQHRVALFEIGNLYHPQPKALLPKECPHLSLLMTGNRIPHAWMQNNNEEKMDFYDLKGVLSSLLDGLHIKEVHWQQSTAPAFHPGRCAEVMLNGHSIGHVGELHPKIRDRFLLPAQPVCVAELDLQCLLACWDQEYTMQELSVYTPIYEDLAFVVDEAIPAAEVEALILKTGQPLLNTISLFDVFRGKQVGLNKKSLAYSLTYQSYDKTLTDQEVEPIREKIIRQLKKELKAELRV